MKNLIAAALIVFGATQVNAQSNSQCTATEKAYKVLMEKYKENRLGLGLAPNGALVETWTNSETGTWTMLVTTAEGISCILASGQGWQESDVPVGDPA